MQARSTCCQMLNGYDVEVIPSDRAVFMASKVHDALLVHQMSAGAGMSGSNLRGIPSSLEPLRSFYPFILTYYFTLLPLRALLLSFLPRVFYGLCGLLAQRRSSRCVV